MLMMSLDLLFFPSRLLVHKSVVETLNLKKNHLRVNNIGIFPLQIASIIDSHAATLTKRAERDVFFLTMQGIVQLVQRYRNGIRGHTKSVVQDLLRQYLRIEMQFQQGELVVLNLLHLIKLNMC